MKDQMETTFEVYVQPAYGGPCTVRERDLSNRDTWATKDEVVAVARQKKESYPNIDFLVHAVTGRKRVVVYRTREDTKR